MNDTIYVGNRMVYAVVFGINSTRKAVRKCEIVRGEHFLTALLVLLMPNTAVDHPIN